MPDGCFARKSMLLHVPQVLCYIKRFLFSNQLGYDELIKERPQCMTQFVLLFCTVEWLRAPLAADVATNNLILYRNLGRWTDQWRTHPPL